MIEVCAMCKKIMRLLPVGLCCLCLQWPVSALAMASLSVPSYVGQNGVVLAQGAGSGLSAGIGPNQPGLDQSTQDGKPPILYCPPVADLEKNEQGVWVSKDEGGWKSMKQSFATQVVKFEGAQWSGVGLGSVMCYYTSGKGADSFPVSLQYSVLVKNPVLTKPDTMAYVIVPNNWSEKTYSDDGVQHTVVMNCAAEGGDIRNCPFLPGEIRKKIDVNQSLQDAKKNDQPLEVPNL